MVIVIREGQISIAYIDDNKDYVYVVDTDRDCVYQEGTYGDGAPLLKSELSVDVRQLLASVDYEFGDKDEEIEEEDDDDE